MSQKGISRWLKGITIIIGIMGLIFFFVIMPILANEIKDMYPEVAYLFWPGMIYGYGVAIGCYAILFYFWKVCREIGRDNSFSKENANSFVVISCIALALSIYWFAGLIYLGLNQWLNPGIGIFMIVAVLISVIIAILAAALSRLILKAYEMKTEGELTI